MKAGYVLDANEHVIKEVGRHWIDLAPAVISAAALTVAALGLAYAFGRFRDLFPALITGQMITALIMALVGLAALIFLTGLWVYRQNRLILTNLHLIQVEQHGLFGREVSQLSLARVQDVAGHRNGLLATILDFGDVEVQSAGQQDNFIFVNAPGPQQLADDCLQAHEHFIETHFNHMPAPSPVVTEEMEGGE